MSLFDTLTSLASGDKDGTNHPAANGIIDFMQNQPGGIAGLISQFQEKGLGEIVQSWIGPGANLPVSTDQLVDVLGQDRIDALSAKVGLPAGVVSTVTAKLLPGIVDRLTPNGEIPS